MVFDRKDFSDQTLLNLYETILFPRLIEEKMLVLLRQGRISKWFSGIGQEAISAGAVAAMATDEWIMPLHRNLAVFTGRQIPLRKLFLQWQGSQEGFSKGRERSFHFGSQEHYICGMISHLGPQLAVAAGAALAYKLSKQSKCALAFTGEGGTSEGDFHEALNLASVWNLPVIFIIENNGYGLSTPVEEQYRCRNLTDRGVGYGMEAVKIDGNNILDLYDTVRGVREYCIREQRPYLIECSTFRMRGHEEASGTKYIDPELFEIWAKKDPVTSFEEYLRSIGLLDEEKIHEIRHRFRNEIEAAVAADEQPVIPNEDAEKKDVYARATESQIPFLIPDTEETRVKKFIDGVKEGLSQSMDASERVILMGQDIAEYGGAFKITEGFLDKFGKVRVRNTPLCESAIVGAALGLALEGYSSVVEMQFADFAAVAFNQIVNNLAKIYYRWGQSAPVVIRMPTGGSVGAGPFHSQSNEAWFTHVPGLKVLYPSSPADAKGLLIAAIADPNPVLFFEHKALYRSISGPLPENMYQIEIGKANLVSKGSDITIITYGAGVHWALSLAESRTNISFDILDLRTLLPLDYDSIRESVAKTGKVVVLHEDTLTGGYGGEISAWIGEHCFELLDAPVYRCASLDTAIPFNLELEKKFLANARLSEIVDKLQSY